MKPYRVAIIGTGRVGYQFSFGDLPDNHAEAVAHHPRCELAAGVNRGREKLEAFGDRFGVSALFHDYEEMLDQVGPDICIVATHPELHCEMVAACAAAPATRAVICEKPMALSLGECDRMIATCEENDTLLQINHNRRWSPEWTLAHSLVRQGAIGELNAIYCCMDGCKPTPSWRSDNEGPLLHDVTHYFDMLDLFAGEVDWLCGMAEQRRRPWAVEDFTGAFLKFRNGVTAVFQASELTEYSDNAFELRGSTGIIRMISEHVQLYQSHPGDLEAGKRLSVERPATRRHRAPGAGVELFRGVGRTAGGARCRRFAAKRRSCRQALSRDGDGDLRVATGRQSTGPFPGRRVRIRSGAASRYRVVRAAKRFRFGLMQTVAAGDQPSGRDPA